MSQITERVRRAGLTAVTKDVDAPRRDARGRGFDATPGVDARPGVARCGLVVWWSRAASEDCGEDGVASR